MIWFGRPGVNLYGLPQGYHKELYPLVLDNLEVHGAGKVANVDPASSALYVVVSSE